MRSDIKSAPSVLAAALFLTACVSLPPEVQQELSPPDGDRPNNYELVDEED